MTDRERHGFLQRLNPAVTTHWHLALAGLMWGVVGAMLCRLALRWLYSVRFDLAITLEALGLLLALIVYWFGFSRIARTNITRLMGITGKSCIFSFQTWKSYLNIAVMITLGLLLRSSSIPREILSVMYNMIGGALFLGGLQYYKNLWNLLT